MNKTLLIIFFLVLFLTLGLTGYYFYLVRFDKSAKVLTWEEAQQIAIKDCNPDALSNFQPLAPAEDEREKELQYIAFLASQLGVKMGDPPGYNLPRGINMRAKTIPSTTCFQVWIQNETRHGRLIYEKKGGVFNTLPTYFPKP